MRERVLVLWVAFVMPILGFAEMPKKLSVGSNLPDIEIDNVRNYPNGKLKFSELKGKFVILDFWNVWCTSCIAAFPKMEQVQEEFKDDLQIVLVTRDSQEKVDKLFARSEKARTGLPLIIGDSILTQYFPVSFPHHVWIEPDGKIKAITSPMNLTRENIEAVLNAEPVVLPTVEQIKNFDNTRALFETIPNHFNEAVEVYSYITRNIAGIFPYTAGASYVPGTDVPFRLALYNRTILDLLRFAFGDFSEDKFGLANDFRRIETGVADSTRFFPPKAADKWQEWKSQHSYNYELQVPVNRVEQMTAFMRQDLQRFFDLEVTIEKRKFPCYILQRTDTTIDVSTKSNEKKGFVTDLSSKTLSFTDVSVAALCSLLSNSHKDLMIADATDFDGNIDIILSIDVLNDFDVLEDELSRFGFILKRGESDFEVLKISDN